MWRRHVCYVCKRSVCGGDEPQPVAHLSHKLQCARQSLKIMVSYGNKYPRHNARPHVVEQSGQCARALRVPMHFHQGAVHSGKGTQVSWFRNAPKVCGAVLWSICNNVLRFEAHDECRQCFRRLVRKLWSKFKYLLVDLVIFQHWTL